MSDNNDGITVIDVSNLRTASSPFLGLNALHPALSRARDHSGGVQIESRKNGLVGYLENDSTFCHTMPACLLSKN